jgi:hypothetical protein
LQSQLFDGEKTTTQGRGNAKAGVDFLSSLQGIMQCSDQKYNASESYKCSLCNAQITGLKTQMLLEIDNRYY